MVAAYEIAQDATRVHQESEENLELLAREFVELMVVCERFQRGSQEHADKLLDYCAEMYLREALFANAAVDAYIHRGGDLMVLVRRARARRHEAKISGWLVYLKHNCWGNGYEQGRTFVRKSVERACMWMGLNLQETRSYLDLYRLRGQS